MTESESVIQNIESATMTAPIAVPVEPQLHPRGHGAFMVVRDGYTVKEIEGAKRGRRVHTFDDIASYAAWLNRHVAARQRAEILVHTDAVVAALDPADPDGDVVRCTLPLHPSFIAWGQAFQAPLDQVTLHRLVLAEAETLGANAEGFSAALLQLKIATEGDFSAEMDALGYMKVVGGTTKQEATVKLPPRFRVTTPILDGVGRVHGEGHDAPTVELATYELDVFLQLKVVGDAGAKRAQFVLSCPRLEVHRRQARRDAATFLQTLLEDGFLVGLGEVKVEKAPKITEWTAE